MGYKLRSRDCRTVCSNLKAGPREEWLLPGEQGAGDVGHQLHQPGSDTRPQSNEDTHLSITSIQRAPTCRSRDHRQMALLPGPLLVALLALCWGPSVEGSQGTVPLQTLRCYNDYTSRLVCSWADTEAAGLLLINVTPHWRLKGLRSPVLPVPAVQPPPPRDVQIYATGDQFWLTWSVALGGPKMSWLSQEDLEFEVVYKRLHESWEDATTVQSNSSQVALGPELLLPSSTYVARVRTLLAPDSDFSGRPSQWSPEVQWDSQPGDEAQPQNLQCFFSFGGTHVLSCSWEVRAPVTSSVSFSLFYRSSPDAGEKECPQVQKEELGGLYIRHSCQIRVGSLRPDGQYTVAVRPQKEEMFIKSSEHRPSPVNLLLMLGSAGIGVQGVPRNLGAHSPLEGSWRTLWALVPGIPICAVGGGPGTTGDLGEQGKGGHCTLHQAAHEECLPGPGTQASHYLEAGGGPAPPASEPRGQAQDPEDSPVALPTSSGDPEHLVMASGYVTTADLAFTLSTGASSVSLASPPGLQNPSLCPELLPAGPPSAPPPEKPGFEGYVELPPTMGPPPTSPVGSPVPPAPSSPVLSPGEPRADVPPLSPTHQGLLLLHQEGDYCFLPGPLSPRSQPPSPGPCQEIRDMDQGFPVKKPPDQSIVQAPAIQLFKSLRHQDYLSVPHC
ncbi:Cytokine receptor common subunit beta [Fukomys damarensis]|uniref:Cytokine receptor common subunit beta n=1 Tax=Fukomys damarensis TaxID=885580 RepID=A0A091E2H3_FUKDA|nr:Cytokine receptor common subunit beta [Fukomys damarensis]